MDNYVERQQQQTQAHLQSQDQGQGHQQRGTLPTSTPPPPAQSPSTSTIAEVTAAPRVANPLDNLTTCQRGLLQRRRHRREDNTVSVQNQFVDRVLCRTPPPVYASLPATPPPSYTPPQSGRGVAVATAGRLFNTTAGGVIIDIDARRAEDVWQQFGVNAEQCQPFNAPLLLGSNAVEYVDVVLPTSSIGGYQQGSQGREQQQELVQRDENAASTVGQQQEQQEQEQESARLFEAQLQVTRREQQQQQQQLRRRRRLHLLQQQRLSNINVVSTDSTSSSSNSSISNRNNNNNNNPYQLNNNNNNNNNIPFGAGGGGSSSDSETYARLPIDSERRSQRRQQRIGRGLRDAYCPDLLHACSLILHQPNEAALEPNDTSNDSSVSNFTATPPPRSQSRCSTEYVEIGDIRPVTRDREVERFRDLQPGNWQVDVGRAVSTPELRPNEYRNGVAIQLNSQRIESSDDVEYQRLTHNSTQRIMGQNLSLRRPRISLTWVLREQQQQQQQQPQQTDIQTPTNEGGDDDDDVPSTTTIHVGNGTAEAPNNNNGCVNGTLSTKQRTEVVPTQLITTSTTNTATTTTTTTTKRYRIKQIPGSTDPLNGYATTPTAHMPANGALAPQKFFSNQNLLEYRDKTRPPSRELLFVCTPQRLPKSYDNSEALSLAKKRNEIRKRLAAKMATLQANGRANADGAEASQSGKSGGTVAAAGVAHSNGIVLEKDELKSLKGTYSEPSLIAASEGQHRRHRHRKRRERNRGPKFGYEINNVDEFLTKCSLASPGNIPVVLSTACTLYQTRPGQNQIEIPLPLGMVVNAVFKNQNWLYVQTPHAEEGYVGYTCCLPLGILPPSARTAGATNNKPAPCWESNGDIFPRPGGNMTDSEKEIRLRGGTRSDGARTPRGKRGDAVGTDIDTANGNVSSIVSATASTCGEHQVDRLYLRAASQPRLVEKAYAQLKSTKQALALRNGGNDEYVTLKQQQQQQQQQHKSQLHVQKHMQQQQQQLQQLHHKQLFNGPYITNGHNGQHLHPKNPCSSAAPVSVSNATPSVASMTHSASFAGKSSVNGSVRSSHHHHASVMHMVSRKQPHGLRQTLVAINTDYSTDSIVLHKGEIVTLCECRESKDHRQWFYVRTRDGREGYIPAEVAGHGYL